MNQLDNSLEAILTQYHQAFLAKQFYEGSSEEDDLMRVFGLTHTRKAFNKQYWGRQLGKCWQSLVTELSRQTANQFSGPLVADEEEICELIIGTDAIETKYRIGSGDSDSLKKLRRNSNSLKDIGYRPVLLILRNDNLPGAITACKTGGWTVLIGEEVYQYLQEVTGVDFKLWLQTRKDDYLLIPSVPD